MVPVIISFESFTSLFQAKRSKQTQSEKEDEGQMFEFPVSVGCLLQIGVKLMLK